MEHLAMLTLHEDIVVLHCT